MRSHEDEELEDEEELAGRKERRARRKLRKKQRGQRRGLRSKQKLQKLRRRSKSSRPGKRGGRRGGQSTRRPGRTSSRSRSPDRSNMPSANLDQPLNSPEELDELPVEEWEDAEVEWDDTEDDWEDAADEWEDDAEDDWDELEEEYLEGTYAELGAAIETGRIRRGDARRIFANVKANIRRKRQQLQVRRNRQTSSAPSRDDGWGPVAKLTSNIRIQAGNGHRAAVMELRPGLYIVADVKDQATLPSAEGGIAGVLPALMARGAANALQTIVQNRRAQREAGGGRRRLWDRQRNNPVLNPPTQPHLSPMSQPLLLAGPVATDIGECCCWTRKEDL